VQILRISGRKIAWKNTKIALKEGGSADISGRAYPKD
jgi:hypothetical protein